MKRRAFILALGGAAAWPFGVRAEQPGGKFWRIGMLETISPALNHVNFDAFQRALRDLGYVEGQNLVIEYRSADGQVDRFPELAIDLGGSKVDLIVTRGTPAVVGNAAAERKEPGSSLRKRRPTSIERRIARNGAVSRQLVERCNASFA